MPKFNDPSRVRICDVPGCGVSTFGPFQWCRTHYRNAHHRGDPRATLRLPKRTLTPFLRAARTFIDRHRDHPGIRAAVDHIRDLMAWGRPALGAKRVGLSSAARSAEFWHRARLQGVDPLDVLARVAAVGALSLWQPDVFVSDKHQRATLGRYVVYLAPLRDGRGWASRPVEIRLRHAIAADLLPLALLARNIAEAINARFDKPDTGRFVSGSDAPFGVPSTTTNDAAHEVALSERTTAP